MVFLLKAAFWLGLVLVLLPTGSKKQTEAVAQINAANAATAATGAFADLSQFCTRRPETCAVSSQVASVLAQRAKDGAIMVYEFIAARREAAPETIKTVPAHRDAATADRISNDTTGSIGTAVSSVMIPRPRPLRIQDTLTATDRLPRWREPGSQG
jgi:hypothetical protein